MTRPLKQWGCLSVPTFWDFIIIITLSSPSSSLPPARLSEQWGCLWAQAFGETLPHSRHYSRQSQACGNASQVATPFGIFSMKIQGFLRISGLGKNLLRGESIDSFNREWVFGAHPVIWSANQILFLIFWNFSQMCRVVCFIAFRCSQVSNICVNSCESLSCWQLLQNWKRPHSFVLDWAGTSPTGNWFCSGLQVLQYLQTDVIVVTSSLGAY